MEQEQDKMSGLVHSQNYRFWRPQIKAGAVTRWPQAVRTYLWGLNLITNICTTQP